MSKLIVLGDSFCHGIGAASTVMDPANTQYAFGKHVADHLDLEYINLAEPGSSSLRTIEKGFAYLDNNYHTGDLVIVGWTSPLRLNVINGKTALQILPEFVWLGNLDEKDLAVGTSDVKCVTDMANESYLDSLGKLHRAFVQNDLFQALENQAYSLAEIFRGWMTQNQIEFRDFSVFGNLGYKARLGISFLDVMPRCDRHPDVSEQKNFANLLLSLI